MTLHILIVEDDDDFVEELHEIVTTLPGKCNIQVARSREEAYEMLENGFLDLVILDLKIPTVSGALDSDPEHGHAVFNRIRTVAPGTPIFVLTGSSAEDFLADLMLKNQQQIDIWSEDQKTSIILFLKKYNVDRCPEMIMRVAWAIECLSEVELECEDIDLNLAEDRLIRIFARKFKGVRCIVSEIGGGLSDAHVIHLRVTNHQGVLVHDAVAKLSTHDDIRREGDCYDSHITRLVPAATPRKLATLEYGAHKLAGIFFGLAEGSDKCVFDIAGNFHGRAEVVIRRVETAMARWIDGVPETRMTIRQIRERLLNDKTLDQVRDTFNLDWIRQFEDRSIQTRWACIHGDLHGKNIFVSPDGIQLIDYGDVGEGPASLDPVTLELSLLFHPHAPGKTGTWPSVEQAKTWGNLEVYLDSCPFPEFIRECRGWALRTAAGKREVAVSAYSYLVRQLKYKDTDKDRALALLDGVRSYYDENT